MIRLENSLAFNYGIGVFETMRLIDGKIEYFDEHLGRLISSLKTIRIYKITPDEIKEKMDAYLVENSMMNGIIKILVNDAGIFISHRENSYKHEDYSNGFKVKISDVQILPKSVYTIKSSNYMINYLESTKAKEEGYDEVLFFNTDKILAEGSKSNIFLICENQIITPSIESGCLKGIIRKKILAEKSYEIVEKDIDLSDLEKADAVFLTNSIMGVMPVRQIDGKTYCSAEHDWIKELIEIYSKRG